MAKFVLTDQRIFLGGYSIEPDVSSIVLDYSAEAKDGTVYGNGTKVNYGGLKSTQVQANGFVDCANSDAALHTAVGVNDTPVSISASASTVGANAYFLQSLIGNYNPIQGTVGDMAAFDLTCFSRSPLIAGYMHVVGAKTATGTSAGIQQGAVSATQKLYATMHVHAIAGNGTQTLDVIVESDDNSGFTTPTTRATFTQVTTSVGGQYLTPVSGAITDTYWRAKWTIAGGGGAQSFSLAVFIGIQ